MKLNIGDRVKLAGFEGTIAKFDPASFMEGCEVVGVLFEHSGVKEIQWVPAAEIEVIESHELALIDCPRCGAKKQHWNKAEV